MASVLAEARGLGLGLTLAHQTPGAAAESARSVGDGERSLARPSFSSRAAMRGWSPGSSPDTWVPTISKRSVPTR